MPPLDDYALVALQCPNKSKGEIEQPLIGVIDRECGVVGA